MTIRFSCFLKNGLLPLLLFQVAGACSKAQSPSEATVLNGAIPQTFPVSTSVLKNCRFKDPEPVYTAGSPIPPNTLLCDEGVARTVSVLNPEPLPAGLSFSMAELALTGTPSQKIAKTTYRFYVENSAGYIVLKMQLTVK